MVRHTGAAVVKGLAKVPFAGQMVDTGSNWWDQETWLLCQGMFDWWYGNDKQRFTWPSTTRPCSISCRTRSPHPVPRATRMTSWGPSARNAAQYVARPRICRIDQLREQANGGPAAQTVAVTERLDPHLDLSKFQLGRFGFGSQFWSPPAGTQSLNTLIDDTRASGLDVRVTGALNAARRMVTWTFTSISTPRLETSRPTHRRDSFLPTSVPRSGKALSRIRRDH